jgi:hypothetical protein
MSLIANAAVLACKVEVGSKLEVQPTEPTTEPKPVPALTPGHLDEHGTLTPP